MHQNKASGRSGKRSPAEGGMSIYQRSDEHLNIHTNSCEIPPHRRGNAVPPQAGAQDGVLKPILKILDNRILSCYKVAFIETPLIIMNKIIAIRNLISLILVLVSGIIIVRWGARG